MINDLGACATIHLSSKGPGCDFNACFPGWGTAVDIELYWTHMSRFNSIVWNSAHVDEIPGQRLAAAHFLSLTVAAPH